MSTSIAAIRKKQQNRRSHRVTRMVQYIKKQDAPFHQKDIAAALGLPRSTVSRLMPYLEVRGVLLCQDHKRRLTLYVPEIDY